MEKEDTIRMDRIEKNLDLLIQGIGELKNAQGKTNDQISALGGLQKQTEEQIIDIKEVQLQTAVQIPELRELQIQNSIQISELRESQKQTDEQLKKTIKKLYEIGKQLGDLGLVQGLHCSPFSKSTSSYLSSNPPKTRIQPI